MLFERIESDGLAHYSYLIGDQNEAVVIDPRRDCKIYLEKGPQNRFNIEHVLETHRNEDYYVGSTALSARTECSIWHADSELDYKYGKPVQEGQSWKIGRLELEAIHTPGHTPGSMSYLLYGYEGEPWVIFTGDALFAGDVGRVDLLGMDRAEELAEMLYDSIYNKILPLDDEVIVCPAHGAGSVCGSSIAERVWTTIGLERNLNPKLQSETKKEFVSKVARNLERPPYFRKVEELNLKGEPVLHNLPTLKPLKSQEFKEKAKSGVVLDTRSDLAFSGAYIPGAINIWLDGLSAFAGWFLPYDDPILLIGNDIEMATKYLIRLGYDNLAGYLAGGMLSWHTSGNISDSIVTISVQELCDLLDEGESLWILDVRSDEEVEENKIPGATHIHLTQIPENIDIIPKEEKIYIFCGSGLRSMIAASILKQEGRDNLVVVRGGTSGWNSVSCPLE